MGGYLPERKESYRIISEFEMIYVILLQYRAMVAVVVAVKLLTSTPFDKLSSESGLLKEKRRAIISD